MQLISTPVVPPIDRVDVTYPLLRRGLFGRIAKKRLLFEPIITYDTHRLPQDGGIVDACLEAECDN